MNKEVGHNTETENNGIPETNLWLKKVNLTLGHIRILDRIYVAQIAHDVVFIFLFCC